MSQTQRRVLLAAPRGFCAGVDRAVQAVEQALARFGPPVYVRHEIVHNTHVIDRLRAAGAVFTDDLDEVPEGAWVVFSAHGVPPSAWDHAARRHLEVIDATCPLVSKVHAEARRYAAAGNTLALIGHPDHVEVAGTLGQAPEQTVVIDPDDPEPGIDKLPDTGQLVWLSQTTLAVDHVARATEAVRARFPDLRDPPSDDICYASTNRQAAVKAIAPRSDLLLVVGSANSSNSRRLVEVGLDAGAAAAYLLDRADQLPSGALDGATVVGVTAGASAPETVVGELLEVLADHGFTTVEDVTVNEETIAFGPPVPLRQAKDDS